VNFITKWLQIIPGNSNVDHSTLAFDPHQELFPHIAGNAFASHLLMVA
jgi:hypothetical protein